MYSRTSVCILTTLGPESVQYTEKFGILKVVLFLHPYEGPAGAAILFMIATRAMLQHSKASERM